MVSTAGSLLRLREGEFTRLDGGRRISRPSVLSDWVGAPDGGPLLYSPRGFVVIDEADRIVPLVLPPGLPPGQSHHLQVLTRPAPSGSRPPAAVFGAYADGRVEEFIPVDLGAPRPTA